MDKIWNYDQIYARENLSNSLKGFIGVVGIWLVAFGFGFYC